MRRVAVALAITALLSAGAAGAHPYSTSRAEVDWNEKTGRFEVALAVLPEELVQMVEADRRGSERFLLNAAAGCDAEIADYLRKHFVAALPSGEAARLEWVGKEIAFEAAWLYFELAFEQPPATLEGLVFKVDLGLELSHEHVNAVQVRYSEDRRGLLFSRLKRDFQLSAK
jgi:hypothetical protein